MKVKISLFTGLLFIGLFAHAQTEQIKQQIIEERIELIVQDSDLGDVDFTVLFDDLDYYFENPLNLNVAKYEELSRLQLLAESHILALLQYRQKYGEIYSMFELSYVPGWDEKIVYLITPFVSVQNIQKVQKTSVKQIVKYGKSELILRQQLALQNTPAYKQPTDTSVNPNQYLGNRQRLYARYRYTYSNNFSFGITGEKDPGEAFFKAPNNYGFDFYSAHLQYAGNNFIKNAIIGDYQFQAGQGLTFWGGFGFRKSPFFPTEVKRAGPEIRPYTAAEENRFMRGAATTVGFKKIQITGFYSQKNVDANVVELGDSLQSELGFSSLTSSGLHRTQAEVNRKDVLAETITGSRITYKSSNFQVGVTGVQVQYQGSFIGNVQPYQTFQSIQNKFQNLGVDYAFVTGTFSFFGEIAHSGKGFAQIHGVNAFLSERFQLLTIIRNYQVTFNPYFSNAFGEKSSNSNEQGIYLAANILPAKGWKISSYIDVYRFPWLSYRIDGPSVGREFSLAADRFVTRKSSMQFFFRTENSVVNTSGELPLNTLGQVTLTQFRFQFDVTATKKWRFRTRIENRLYTEQSEQFSGILFYQDVYWSISEKWDIKTRMALFNTDNYNTRIYAYENDFRYQFSVPAYYDLGARNYVLVTYQAGSKLQIAARWAQLHRFQETTFGSGLDSYVGKNRSEIKAQLILKI